jgi:mannitol 2-dehydrogenase
VPHWLRNSASQNSDRIPKCLLPVIRENLASGGEIRRSVAMVASWARYDEGVDEQGEPIVIVDRLRDELMVFARQQTENPLAFIETVPSSATSWASPLSAGPPRCVDILSSSGSA